MIKKFILAAMMLSSSLAFAQDDGARQMNLFAIVQVGATQTKSAGDLVSDREVAKPIMGLNSTEVKNIIDCKSLKRLDASDEVIKTCLTAASPEEFVATYVAEEQIKFTVVQPVNQVFSFGIFAEPKTPVVDCKVTNTCPLPPVVDCSVTNTCPVVDCKVTNTCPVPPVVDCKVTNTCPLPPVVDCSVTNTCPVDPPVTPTVPVVQRHESLVTIGNKSVDNTMECVKVQVNQCNNVIRTVEQDGNKLLLNEALYKNISNLGSVGGDTAPKLDNIDMAGVQSVVNDIRNTMKNGDVVYIQKGDQATTWVNVELPEGYTGKAIVVTVK